jgi:tetratricopeptide (TPR) repeat protein
MILLTVLLALTLGLEPASAEEAECRFNRFFVADLLGDDLGPPVIAGSINGKPTRFMLDTGGFWGLLSWADAAGLPKAPVPEGFSLLDATGASIRGMVKVKEPSVGGLKLPQMDFATGSVSTLGGNLLHSFDVEIDPIEQRVSFFLPKTCGGQNVYWPHQDVAVIRFAPNDDFRIALHVVIDGQKVEALLDTGSHFSAMDDRFARNNFGIEPGRQETEVATMVTAGGGAMLREYRHQFGTLDLGGITLAHPWLRIDAQGHSFFHPGAELPVILGMDVISQLHIYIAYKEHKIYATTLQQDIEAGRKPVGGGKPSDRVARWNAREWIATGWSDARAGRRADAGQAFDRAVALTPDHPDALLARAEFRLDGNDGAGADADIEHALAAASDSADVHATLGSLLLRTGKTEAAIREFSKAIALAPDETGLRIRRAHAYVANKQSDLALADADGLVQRWPTDAYALGTRCWVEAALGRYDPALIDCNAALAAAPKAPALLETRGFMNLKAGRFDAAIADYDAGLTVNPKSAAALYGRAQAKRAKGDAAGADADLAAARAVQPDIEKSFGT